MEVVKLVARMKGSPGEKRGQARPRGASGQ